MNYNVLNMYKYTPISADSLHSYLNCSCVINADILTIFSTQNEQSFWSWNEIFQLIKSQFVFFVMTSSAREGGPQNSLNMAWKLTENLARRGCMRRRRTRSSRRERLAKRKGWDPKAFGRCFVSAIHPAAHYKHRRWRMCELEGHPTTSVSFLTEFLLNNNFSLCGDTSEQVCRSQQKKKTKKKKPHYF